MEREVIGLQWDRCKSINISNHYNKIPTLTINEERVTEIDGELYHKHNTDMVVEYDESDELLVTLYNALNQLYNREKAK